jgi:hypothetical protein
MEDESSHGAQVKLLASTDDSIARDKLACEDLSLSEGSFFKSVQWYLPFPATNRAKRTNRHTSRSADGTTLFTSSSTNVVSGYVVPSDLLQPRDGPLSLRPQGSISLPEPTHATAPAPYFSLPNPYTHVVLTAAVDHPIQLHHAFPTSSHSDSDSPPALLEHRSAPLTTYPLIHTPTEAYLPVFSLIWPSPGTHFLAGTKNLIAYFDAERSASGSGTAAPLLRVPTIPSARHRAKGGGVGMRGSVSALAVSPAEGTGLVAAGTWTRWVGLYDLARAGGCAANWCVAAAAGGEGPGRRGGGVGGSGILQTIWSPCGRYLVINERRSSGLLVYDVRVTGKALGWLEGRNADTQQRMTCDVFPGADDRGGFEVWAGAKDGMVKVWEGVGNEEGYVRASRNWQAHGSTVGSTAMHLSGSVVATCSGSWTIEEDGGQSDDSENSDSDTSSNDDSCSAVSSSISSGSGGEGIRDPSKPRLKVEGGTLKIWSIGGEVSNGPDYIEPES